MTHVLCPSCTELVPAKALKCARCGDLVRDYVECPDCRERVRSGARVCRYCGFRFARATPPPIPGAQPAPPPAAQSTVAAPQADTGEVPRAPEADSGDYTIGATLLGGLLDERSLSSVFAPPELRLAGGVVTLTRWSSLGFRRDVERLAVGRIGAVDVDQGGAWSRLLILPLGHGPVLEIGGLRHDEARAMATLIEKAATEARKRPTPPAARTVPPGISAHSVTHTELPARG